jgi:uncharacterized protein YjbI with pentapeptide repeats
MWGMIRALRPKLFISYAREDQDIADRLALGLGKLGFVIFIDRHDIETGVPFQQRIERSLGIADGVLFLVSEAFACSVWCQAEVQQANARGRRLLPIYLQPVEELPLTAPSREVLSKVQGLPGWSDPDECCNRLARDHADLKWRPIRRLAFWLGLIAALAIGAGWVARKALASLNTHNEREKAETVKQEARNSSAGYSGEKVFAFLSGVTDRPGLRSSLEAAARDRSWPAASRWNAALVANALDPEKEPEGRFVLTGWSWRGGTVAGAKWVDVSFNGCRVEKLQMRGSTLAGIGWFSLPENLEEASRLLDSRFEDCAFYGVWFERCVAMDCQFLRSRFDGCKFELEDWSGVTIGAEEPAAEPSVVTAGLTTLSRCTITNSRSPPKPGVLDFSENIVEVNFKGAVFEDCEFRGWVRADWFKQCSFYACRFPDDAVKKAIMDAGNSIEEKPFSTH